MILSELTSSTHVCFHPRSRSLLLRGNNLWKGYWGYRLKLLNLGGIDPPTQYNSITGELGVGRRAAPHLVTLCWQKPFHRDSRTGKAVLSWRACIRGLRLKSAPAVEVSCVPLGTLCRGSIHGILMIYLVLKGPTPTTVLWESSSWRLTQATEFGWEVCGSGSVYSSFLRICVGYVRCSLSTFCRLLQGSCGPGSKATQIEQHTAKLTSTLGFCCLHYDHRSHAPFPFLSN